MLNYKGFKTKIHYSEEDEIYYGSIENIKDSVSFHGKTVKEAANFFMDAVEDYIDLCCQLKKEIKFIKI